MGSLNANRGNSKYLEQGLFKNIINCGKIRTGTFLPLQHRY
jgi:hypothetical protein